MDTWTIGKKILGRQLAVAIYPQPGSNVVAVTLTKRDPNVDMEFQLAVVDCSIAYHHHRHFPSDPIQY